MSGSETYSKACCSLPPVEAEHSPKGEYIEIDGVKTYHSGSKSAKFGIVTLYDVFGFAPQTIQGADLLAGASGGSESFQVFMPDLLEGKYADAAMFSGKEEENKRKAEFFQPGGPANVAEVIKKLLSFTSALKEGEFKGIEKLGALGFCWGGKVICLTSGEGTPFSVAAEGHPSMKTKEDGLKVTIPYAILASKDEDPDVMKGFVSNLKVPHHFDTYAEMPHGWMAARGEAKSEPGKSEYIRAYTAVANFFHEHLAGKGGQVNI